MLDRIKGYSGFERFIGGAPFGPIGRVPNKLRALIAQLFGNGEQGALYVPQPVVLGQQVLYQDAAGTVPVMSDGDPVGLMLDVSQGLELGENVVPAPYTAGGWEQNVSRYSLTQDSESLMAEVIQSYTYVSLPLLRMRGPQTVNLDEGWYSYTAEINVIEPSPVNPDWPANYTLHVSGDISDQVIRPLSGGKVQFIFRSNAAQTVRIGFGISSNDLGSIIEYRNPEVKKLPGNHATQSTSAARPLHRTSGLLQQYDGVDDEMNVTLPSIAEATVITATASGVDVQHPVDLSGDSYTITESHSGIIIREGALSSEEQQRAVDYLSSMPGVTL